MRRWCVIRRPTADGTHICKPVHFEPESNHLCLPESSAEYSHSEGQNQYQAVHKDYGSYPTSKPSFSCSTPNKAQNCHRERDHDYHGNPEVEVKLVTTEPQGTYYPDKDRHKKQRNPYTYRYRN
jgi:hypothetical protein